MAANAIVMWVADQDIAVNDHGFSGEVVFNAFVPAPMLGDSAFGDIRAGDDPGEMYLLRRTLAFVWPYDDRQRLHRRARLRGRRLPGDHAARPRRRHHRRARRRAARARDEPQGPAVSGRLTDSVALITGGARDRGRAHAVRLAEEGADVVVVDRCASIALGALPDAGAGRARADGEARRGHRPACPRGAGRRPRPRSAAEGAVEPSTLTEFGRLDVVVANAGIDSFTPPLEMARTAWQDMIDINLTGAGTPSGRRSPPVEQGRGGSHRPHELDRRADRVPEPRALHGGQARPHRPDDGAGRRTGAAPIR